MAAFTFQWDIADEGRQHCEHKRIFAENSDVALTSIGCNDADTVDAMQEHCECSGCTPRFYLTDGDSLYIRVLRI